MALSGFNIVLPKQKYPFCLSKSFELLYIYTIIYIRIIYNNVIV